MSIDELCLIVRNMRDAQKLYFRFKEDRHLREARQWESRVDKAVEQVLNPPTPGLFEGPA